MKDIYNNSNKAIDLTHKVFLSFYNKDEWYKDRFEKIFKDLFINKSIMLFPAKSIPIIAQII